ncbi:MAG TPA: diguanylate cyclase, partial [Acidimicrobiales bacterium]|nr:diguanylate cyclase [Acidimicrobiales bacterium]
AAEGLFRAVFDGSPVATAVVDLAGRFVQVNDALAMICGRTADDLVGRTFAEVTHPDDLAVDEELLAEVRSGRRGGYQMEKRFVHRAGHEVWVELTVSTVRDAAGAITHFVSHVEDISGRKALIDTADSSEELAYWATHDHLTGLPNRRYLDSYLTSSLGPRRRADDRLVVLFLDLDDFKPVNDRHGHQTGDEVLRAIARRLRNTAREDELVARYGGDEFVVVTTRARTAYDVSLLAERILSAVRTPIVGLTAEPIVVGASVGIGHANRGEDPTDLLRRADAASYRAKRAGKGRIELAPSTSDGS